MAEEIKPTCWKDWEEWHDVYKKLYCSEDKISQINGLKLVDVWRSRTAAKLPVAVECTASLIVADIGLGTCSAGNREMSIAMALVRFVNGMADLEQKGSYARSVNSIAEEIGIPDWLVDLRHEATHAALPSIDILEAGLGVALQWLKEKYWEETYCCILKTEESMEMDLEQLLRDYIEIQLSKAKASERKQLMISCMESMSKHLTTMDKVRTLLLPSLLKDGVIFPNKSQQKLLTKEAGVNSAIINFIDLWLPLIKHLQAKFSNFVFDLVKELINFTGEGKESSRKFVDKIVLKLIKEPYFDIKDSTITNFLLRYSLHNPNEETYDILEQCRSVRYIDENTLARIKDFFVLASQVKGVFSFPNNEEFSSEFISPDCENLLHYFDKNPIDGVRVKELETKIEVKAKKMDLLESWEAIIGKDWTEIPIGTFLDDYEPVRKITLDSERRDKSEVIFPTLPSEIDDLPELAISRVPTSRYYESERDMSGESHVITQNDYGQYPDLEMTENDNEQFGFGDDIDAIVGNSVEIQKLKHKIVLF